MAAPQSWNMAAAAAAHQSSKFELVSEYMKVRGLVKNHLESFDYFIERGMKRIVSNCRVTCESGIQFRFEDIYLGKFDITSEFSTIQPTPSMCRLLDWTYCRPIFVDVEVTTRNNEKKSLFEINIGRMPIMLRSQSCILNRKTDEELTELGECPLDPGGYFVIRGTEKVILMQESLCKNKIFVHCDKKMGVIATVISSGPETKIIMEKENFYVRFSEFNEQIPIMVIFKAMGTESDQEVVQMLGRDPRYGHLLIPSIQEYASASIHSEGQALTYLQSKAENVMDILQNKFLANVPIKGDYLRPKCIYLAVMLRRMMDSMLESDMVDDTEYVGNKRLELSGQLIALLFEDLFKTMCTQVKKEVDKAIMEGRASSDDSVVCKYLNGNKVFQRLEMSISTGNWDVKGMKMHRKGVTQVVSRLSYIAILSHMTRISSSFQKSQKVRGPRAVHPSQWGMLCPVDTPVGEACGLVRNLALIAHVTTDADIDEEALRSLCHSLGVERLEVHSGEELHARDSYLVMLNGRILGKHRRPQRFANAMRKLRRARKIEEFVSVFVNEKQHCVYIASDGGGVCRPLVIADRGVSRIKEHHMKELRDRVRVFDDFLCKGLIEYLDVNEENNAEIALYEGEAGPTTTHIEIEPFTILGVSAGLIPFPHHDQSPRHTYQCAMGKQAMGNIACNQLSRMDTLLNLLVYPQRPLLTTKSIELVGYDKLGAGQNATVAVMSYSGYDIENAVVMNKSSLDRGFGRCIVMKKYSAIKQTYKNQTSDRIIRRTGDLSEQILDADGIAAPGERIKAEDVYIKMQTPWDTRSHINKPKELPDSAYKNAFQKYRGAKGETGVIDRVALFSDVNNNLCIKLLIRHTRRPEVGDKFSSRHGHKGVCGTIVQQEDFPFSEHGICPDLIINPHEFSSHLTVGKMMELLGSKAGASCGKFHYGSAFGESSGHADKVEAIGETLVKHGFCYNGKDFLYSGIMGSPLQAYIFMGPIYYQKLKHMVLDKMHARASCPRVTLTRQPTEGRSRDGGLRLGEMERDCLIAYGASNLIYERLMLSSDVFQVQVCRKCGLLGYYHHKLKNGYCSMCKNGENISTMKLPYACKLLFQELQSMNVVPRLKLTEP